MHEEEECNRLGDDVYSLIKKEISINFFKRYYPRREEAQKHMMKKKEAEANGDDVKKNKNNMKKAEADHDHGNKKKRRRRKHQKWR